MPFALQVIILVSLKSEVVHEDPSPPTNTENGGAITSRGAWRDDAPRWFGAQNVQDFKL